MRATPSLLSGLLLLLATSCGPTDPGILVDEANANLTKDPEASLSSFEEALAAMDPSDPRFLEATLGTLRARCFVDPAAAKEGFLALAEETGLEANDYRILIADLVASAKEVAASGTAEDVAAGLQIVGHAIDIAYAGKDAYPDDGDWPGLVDRVGETADALNAPPDMLKRLEGIGYLGKG